MPGGNESWVLILHLSITSITCRAFLFSSEKGELVMAKQKSYTKCFPIEVIHSEIDNIIEDDIQRF